MSPSTRSRGRRWVFGEGHERDKGEDRRVRGKWGMSKTVTKKEKEEKDTTSFSYMWGFQI